MSGGSVIPDVLRFSSNSDSDESTASEGLVWATFERKYERWHFGPNDNRLIAYDGIKKNCLYRFVDDEDEERYASSPRRELTCNYEVALFVDDKDAVWKEKVRGNQEFILVAQGSYDRNNSRLRYDFPVMVVDRATFDELKEEMGVANSRSATARPRDLSRDMRRRDST